MSDSQESVATRGRPKVIPGNAVHVRLRLSEEQREKLDRLGGAAWVRQKIDAAKEPEEPKRPSAPWRGADS